MQTPTRPVEPFRVRLLLVLGAECVYAMLVHLALGEPPSLVATVAFGVVLAIVLALQAARDAAAHPD
jgi:hypothetical protein